MSENIFESGVATGSCTGASPLDGSTVARGSVQEFGSVVELFEDKGAAWLHRLYPIYEIVFYFFSSTTLFSSEFHMMQCHLSRTRGKGRHSIWVDLMYPQKLIEVGDRTNVLRVLETTDVALSTAEAMIEMKVEIIMTKKLQASSTVKPVDSVKPIKVKICWIVGQLRTPYKPLTTVTRSLFEVPCPGIQ
ncbi:hypothetical protein BDN71DRAFT_1493463 [Pleurotus eryngii]|uniref:Uncharacterized protein n=1 Tax=Pleurotus eryngii TaxID=5323 RepID=A0A9P6A3P2_PLEER|nr:hypothetical protein BDN71DRAFT_1493463 [Pleurotus eryngii]